jgi:hypothetical protein
LTFVEARDEHPEKPNNALETNKEYHTAFLNNGSIQTPMEKLRRRDEVLNERWGTTSRMKLGLCACHLNCAGIKSSAWAGEQRVRGDGSIDTFICIFSPSKHVSVMQDAVSKCGRGS